MTKRREHRMKRSAALALLAALLLAAAAQADEAHRGLYLAGSGQLLRIEGTGTWNGNDFDPTATMSGSEDDPVGLNWAEKLLIGVSPGFGWRIGDRFAVQLNYEFFFPRRSSESYQTTEGSGTYAQALDWEWRQSSIDAIALYYPSYHEANDWNLFLYGGVQRLMVDVDAATSESLTALLGYSDYDTISDFAFFTSGLDCWGGLVGLGAEIPAETMNVSVALRVQYAYARADQTFFDTPDFDVSLGGFSLKAGLNWYFSAD